MAENKGGLTIGTGSKDDSVHVNADGGKIGSINVDKGTHIESAGTVMTGDAQKVHEEAIDNRLNRIFNPIGTKIQDTGKTIDSATTDFHKGLDKFFGKKDTNELKSYESRFDSGINLAVPSVQSEGNEMSK